MLSVILPSRNEQFLQKTITDVLSKAKGEIEVIAALDGYWPNPCLVGDDRLKIVHRGVSVGMRNIINTGVAIASGKYIMKLDAHCMVDEGFDLKLIAESTPNTVQIPRRKRLDAENWCEHNVGKPDIDYMYICYPDDENDFGGPGYKGRLWDAKNKDKELNKELVSDLMTMQGSCWFMERDYFYELELLDDENYASFGNESQEISFKAWLSGGRVVRNKKTWYAHLHKGKRYGRGYLLDKRSVNKSTAYTNKWTNYKEAWDKQTLPLTWLIKKFWPMPEWTEEKYEKLFKEPFNKE